MITGLRASCSGLVGVPFSVLAQLLARQTLLFWRHRSLTRGEFAAGPMTRFDDLSKFNFTKALNESSSQLFVGPEEDKIGADDEQLEFVPK